MNYEACAAHYTITGHKKFIFDLGSATWICLDCDPLTAPICVHPASVFSYCGQPTVAGTAYCPLHQKRKN